MTPPNDFANRLEGLIAEIAAETNSFKRFGLIQQQDALLANHAQAIARLVRAAEMAQESLARHEEACKGWIDDHHLNTKLALRDALNELERRKG